MQIQFRSQLIWIYNVCKGSAYPGSAGPGFVCLPMIFISTCLTAQMRKWLWAICSHFFFFFCVFCILPACLHLWDTGTNIVQKVKQSINSLIIWAATWEMYLMTCTPTECAVGPEPSVGAHVLTLRFILYTSPLYSVLCNLHQKQVTDRVPPILESVYTRFCIQIYFLFFSFISSLELCSGWAIVITFRPSSVRPCVRASVR